MYSIDFGIQCKPLVKYVSFRVWYIMFEFTKLRKSEASPDFKQSCILVLYMHMSTLLQRGEQGQIVDRKEPECKFILPLLK